MTIQGLDAALSALWSGQQRMDALANDTANVNTVGFKAAGKISQGALIETGQPLDLAIVGSGSFRVARPGGGTRLTRAGSFQLDASARIVTSDGDALVPAVQLPAGTDASAIRIGRNGSVSIGGVQVAQIQLVGRGVIRQGALESSNVDLADTAVGTIKTRTSYAAAIRALHVQDEMWASLLQLRDGSARR
jgi:flagellar basal-body rod protein FlgG